MHYKSPESCQMVAICNYLSHAGPANAFAIVEAIFPGDPAMVQKQLDKLCRADAIHMPDGVSYVLSIKIDGASCYAYSRATGTYSHYIISDLSDPVLILWTWIQQRIDNARRLSNGTY